MNLRDTFIKLKQDTNSITHNPLLDCFDEQNLSVLDELSNTDAFIAEKRKKILKLVSNLGIDFNPKLKGAYDEYSEALTFLLLKSKFFEVSRVAEGGEKTPDFELKLRSDKNETESNCTIFAELKSMSFVDNDSNYKNTMTNALEARIDADQQIERGNSIGIGIFEIQPLFKSGKNYNSYSTKYAIEILIDKISQNIKKDQFSRGETVLIVDLKQIALPSSFIEGSVPIYQEKQYQSNVSGIHWNVAFGKPGHLIYKKIEFEGEENIDGELEREGILINRTWIKAVIFLHSTLGERAPKIIGLYKKGNINECLQNFLYRFCDFVNNDKNTSGWQLSEDV